MATAVINMAEQVSVEQDVEPFGLSPASGTAGLYDHIFNILSILHAEFQSGWTSLQFHQQ